MSDSTGGKPYARIWASAGFSYAAMFLILLGVGIYSIWWGEVINVANGLGWDGQFYGEDRQSSQTGPAIRASRTNRLRGRPIPHLRDNGRIPPACGAARNSMGIRYSDCSAIHSHDFAILAASRHKAHRRIGVRRSRWRGDCPRSAAGGKDGLGPRAHGRRKSRAR